MVLQQGTRFIKLIPFLSLSVILLTGGCKKAQQTPVIKGCTSECSENYNPEANSDDGSCVPSRNKYFGTYSVTSTCSGPGAHHAGDTIPDHYTMIMEPHPDNVCGLKVTYIHDDTISSIGLWTVSNNELDFYHTRSQTSGWVIESGGHSTLNNDTLIIATYHRFDNICDYCCTKICVRQ